MQVMEYGSTLHVWCVNVRIHLKFSLIYLASLEDLGSQGFKVVTEFEVCFNE